MAMAMGGSRHSKISVKCQKKCGVSSESHEIWWNMIGIDDLFGVDHPILVSFFFWMWLHQAMPTNSQLAFCSAPRTCSDGKNRFKLRRCSILVFTIINHPSRMLSIQKKLFAEKQVHHGT